MTKPCPACGVEIIFAKSPGKGSPMPLDSKAACYRIENGNAVKVDGVFVSHFKTCSDPGRFSAGVQRPATPMPADAKRIARRLGCHAAIVITFGNGGIGASSWGDSTGATDEAAKQARLLVELLTQPDKRHAR